MTITQTVEIPDHRMLTFEVPPQIPAGKAIISLTVVDNVPQMETGQEIRLTKSMIDEMLQKSPHTQALTGILHTEMTVEQIRDERLAKYLK